MARQKKVKTVKDEIKEETNFEVVDSIPDHKCPICKGRRYINKNKSLIKERVMHGDPDEKKCFYCDGLGIVTYPGETRLWVPILEDPRVKWYGESENVRMQRYGVQLARKISDVFLEN